MGGFEPALAGGMGLPGQRGGWGLGDGFRGLRSWGSLVLPAQLRADPGGFFARRNTGFLLLTGFPRFTGCALPCSWDKVRCERSGVIPDKQTPTQ